MADPTDIPEEDLDIELTGEPLCRHFARKVGEPCWGEVKRHIEGGHLTCVGHAYVGTNGRYYRETDLIKVRKTGGRLYPTFQPLASAPLPDADPELVMLWYLNGDGDRAAAMNRATREAEALCMVNDAYGRTKLPRDPANNPPPPSNPVKPSPSSLRAIGKVMSEGGDKITDLMEIDIP